MPRLSSKVKNYVPAKGRGVCNTKMSVFDAIQETLNTMFEIRCSTKKTWGYEWYDLANGWYPKAYEMTSCFDGILEMYRITGEEKLLKASEALYEILIKYESNILGSVGYCERYQHAADYADSATEICDVLHWMRLLYLLQLCLMCRTLL